MPTNKPHQVSFEKRVRKLNQSKTIRLSIFIAIVGFLMIFSNPAEIIYPQDISAETPTHPESTHVSADNFYITYTADYVSYIATGSVAGERGFAYVSKVDHALYVVNPMNGLTQGFPLPSIGTTLDHTLCAIDIDHDTETEFVVGHDNTTHILIVVADFNDGSIDIYPLSIPALDQLLIGDFNGDTTYEFAAVDKKLTQTIEFYDPDTSTQIGIYSPGKNIDYVDMGRLTSPYRDSFAVAMNNNLTLVQGNGNPVNSLLRGNIIRGVKTFNSTATVYDDIVISEGNGIATCLRSDTLTQVFATGLVAGTTRPLSFMTGNFTGDSQEDLVAVSVEHDVVWFLNGSGGGLIGVNYDQLSGDFRYDVGKIDSDDIDDVAIRKAAGSPTFIHGDGFTTGYVKDEASGVGNVYLYDVNNDGKSDTLAVAGYQVYTILADTKIPALTVEPITPTHPTALDDYITIAVGIYEESTIESARVYVRQVGDTAYPIQIDLMPNAPKVKYYAFLTGLEPGFYEYYIHFVDSYRNEAFNGTSASPIDFEIIGNTAWEVVKTDIGIGRNVHIFDKGNTSLGEEVLYTANWNQSALILQIDKYAITGEFLESVNVSVGAGEIYDFGIYTAMIDGDASQDILLIMSNMTGTSVYVFHGENMSLFFSSSDPVAITSLDAIALVDDDGDNKDELHVLDNSNLRLCRVDDEGTWTTNAFASPMYFGAANIAQTANDDTWQILTVSNETRIDFYDAANLTMVRTAHLDIDPSFTEVNLLGAIVLNNATLGHQQFALQYTLWNISGPTSRFYLFDVFTPDFNSTNMDYFDLHVRNIIPYDQDMDGTDEIFMITLSGELIALSLNSGVTVHWTLPIGTSQLTGYVFSDFDGNGREDLVLFTHQDQKLRCVDTRGFITREINLAEIALNPINIGDIDPGLGEEIACYPIIKDWSEYKVGAYRDLDWFTRINVTSTLQATTILQGNAIVANVSVENIFGESLSDATVTMTARFATGQQTSALLYSTTESQFVYDETPNYPIGTVNLTLDISHSDYQPIINYNVGQVTIRSQLVVNVHQEGSGLQGENKTISITVTDSQSHIIADAAVDVIVDATLYTATFVDPDYQVFIPSLTWRPGDYLVNVTADHPYAIAPKSIVQNFRVLTDTLIVSNNIPSIIDQNQPLQGWLNITDSYTNPLSDALVKIRSGEREFTLTQIEPGKYFLDDFANLPIGNYTFTVVVNSIYVSGDEFGNFSIVVSGNMIPSIEYPTEADAGTIFTVSVFVFDAYGTTPAGAMVIVEFGGANYTAIQIGGPEFAVDLNASTAIGLNQFTVYVNSTYGNDWSDVFDFYIYSPATITLVSDAGWNFVQGTITTLRVNVTDWSGSLISGATVSLLSPISRSFVDNLNGTYTLDLSTFGFSPGNYNIIVSVSQEYLAPNQITHQLNILGNVEVEIDYLQSILNHQSTTFNFTVVDQYGNPLTNFNYNIVFEWYTISSSSTSHEFSWSITPNLEPGYHWLNISIDGSYLITSTHNFSVPIKGVVLMSIISPVTQEAVVQGNDVNFTLTVQDLIGTNIVDAEVIVQIKGNNYGLIHIGSGVYSALISTTSFALGSYNATISVSHAFMNADSIWRVFLVNGTAVVSLVTTPSTALNHQDLTFNITLTDQYGNPVNQANYSLSFNGQSTSGTTSSYKFSWTITPTNPPGLYSFNISLEGGYLISKNYTFSVILKGEVASIIHSPSSNEVWAQGDSVNFTISIHDLIGSDITGAQVTVVVYGSSHTMSMMSDGIYSADISTIGFPLGRYNATIMVSHPYMNLEAKYIVFILKGDALITLEYSPSKLYNHENATFNFTIRDTYGNPVNAFNYSILFGSLYSTSGSSGSYRYSWETEAEFYPSLQWLNITLNSTYLYTKTYNYSIAIFGSSTISIYKPIELSLHTQGDEINFTVIVEDLIGTEISSAQVRVLLAGVTYTLYEISAGTYSANISTVGLKLDHYSANITITHGYLDTAYSSVSFNLIGTPHLSVSMNPNPVSNKENVTFNMELTDLYGNPINAFNYSLSIEEYSFSKTSDWYQFSWEIDPSWIPGQYYLIVDINSTYTIDTQFNVTVAVQGTSSASILDPVTGSSYNQGEFINFTVHVTDELFNNITGADVTVVLYGSSFTLNMTSPGLYTGKVSTVGLPLGSYTAAITVSQAFLDTQHLSVSLSLLGYADVTYSVNNDVILNDEDTTFTFFVRDQYGNPLSLFNYSIELGESFQVDATSSSYTFSWIVQPSLVPGQYFLNFSVSSTYIRESNYSWIVNVFGEQSASFLSPALLDSITQGDLLLLSISLQDLNLNNISSASVVVTIGSTSYTLNEVSPGIYNRTITTTHLSLGEYTARATIQHSYLVASMITQNFTLIGNGKPSVTYEQPVYVGNDTVFTIGMFDSYSYSIQNFNWTVAFQGTTYEGSTAINENAFNLTIPIKGPPGVYWMDIEIENPYLTSSIFHREVIIRSEALGEIILPTSEDSYLQANDSIPFVITVADSQSNWITDAQVRVQIHSSVYDLESYGNGTYHTLISTVGWRYEEYPYFIRISHPYMELLELNDTVRVIADPVITITSADTAYKYNNFTIEIGVSDLYLTPITGLTIEVTFVGETKTASEIEDGKYRVVFGYLLVDADEYEICVSVQGEKCIAKQSTPKSVLVAVPAPNFDSVLQEDIDFWMLAVGIVLIISLAGMGIYFRVASSIPIDSRSSECAEEGIRRLDITYGIVFVISMLIFIHSLAAGTAGEYALAITELILLLGLSVLLYGLWLYRDSYSAILQRGSLSRGRMIAGIWHLILVPVMIVQIVIYGEQWNDFSYLVLRPNIISIGPITLPMMILTIFGTYISSIVVVVVNHYRETSKGLNRIQHMQEESTPKRTIVQEEKSLLVEKTSSSIRTKFLMFLLLIGATTVSTLDFIRSTNLALLILLPVVFLILIPFISSRMIKFLARVRARPKRGDTFTP